MTATPRIYGDNPKKRAIEQRDVILCSMDNDALFGKNLHVLTFEDAVERGLLVDYKVIVFRLSEDEISGSLQHLLANGNNELIVSDAAKIVGAYKALSMQGHSDELADKSPMRRAVAFCQVIEHNPKSNRTHKVSSKHIARMFQSVVEAYQEVEEPEVKLICEAHHVDGTMNATQRDTELDWLKSEDASQNHCRILTNVRCLGEGVNVPALDAVMFLTPRQSLLDVVQSVGRVMRTAPGKELGHVILPVVIPSGKTDEALKDQHTFKAVWQALSALRSHDERFGSMLNRIEFDGHDPRKDRNRVIG